MQLPYSRLYIRTAVHIGIALAAFVLIGAASLGLIAAWELQGYIKTRQSTLGEAAAGVLQEGGESALIEWMQTEADVPDDVSIYILDSRSRDILGREVPVQYADFIRDSVVGKVMDPGSAYEPARLAPRITGPDGQQYSFLVLPKGISLWGSPAISIGLLLAALLVIATVAWLIARTIGRPVSQLQFAARELASGNTAARAPEVLSTRRDELGVLAADFNFMAAQLTQLMERRESVIQEMSHELRSPLTRLQAAVALAAADDNIGEKARLRIEQEITRMNRVIGEILRYSSLDAAVSQRKRLVRVDKLLGELAEIETIEADQHNCEIVLDAPQPLTVIGDPELLRIGFENVLRNAIRYTPAGEKISITAKGDAKHVTIDIDDRGPGVAPDSLEKIFEPYFLVATGGQEHDSTGLGLAIVKRVFEGHGGTITASLRDGGGLRFRIQLPLPELE